MKNLVIAIIVVVILIGGAFLLFRNKGDQDTTPAVTNEPATISPGATTGAESNKEPTISATITYTDSGFSPSSVTVKSGGKITWVNDSSSEVQIGANPHPVHTGNREVSGGEFVLTLQPDQQSTVTVDKIGSFGYHNHLNPSQGGSITVE